jgi:hypothetical protein
MKTTALFLLAILASLAGSSANALPITFTFSFHDYYNGGDVTGIINGLNDNGNGQAATSVYVTSNSAGYGVGEYVGAPFVNLWDVVNGVISPTVDFTSLGIFNTAPDVVCCSLAFDGTAAGLSKYANIVTTVTNSVVTFTSREETNVPLPAPLALIGLGLLGVGISRSRQRLVD